MNTSEFEYNLMTPLTLLLITCSTNTQYLSKQITQTSQIAEDEVWDTIKALAADKAPTPDGYTRHFYKACWQLIKADFMVAIITLQQGNARKLELLNSAYLTLIPKKEEGLPPANYRPISLVRNFTKLITLGFGQQFGKEVEQHDLNESERLHPRPMHS
jgi:hypothetical protein